jgi:hypothetical protein
MELELNARVAVGESSKVFELSLSKDYVSHWGMVQAVRELIQNALDSDSPFEYEFEETEEGERCLRLISQFTTLPPSTLLLGTTSKAGADDKIGSFGEGYKIAMLVLTRLGHEVQFKNGDRLWRPKFRYSKKYETEVLVIETFPLQHNRGLTVEVHGLSEDDERDIRASCLKMQPAIGEVISTRYGDILLDKPGVLYVGGLYICDVDMKYGYNILPAHITLERDRQTVNNWDLQGMTLECWLDTGRTNQIAAMIEDEVRDVAHAEYGLPDLVKEACYQQFVEKNPGKIVARSQSELNKMIEAGMTNTVYLGGAYGYAVSQSDSYKARKQEIVEDSPTVVLRQWLTRNQSEMSAVAITNFDRLIEKSKAWKF